MESPMNGFLSLTSEMQKKFVTLGNLSLRMRNCVNNNSFIKLNYYIKKRKKPTKYILSILKDILNSSFYTRSEPDCAILYFTLNPKLTIIFLIHPFHPSTPGYKRTRSIRRIGEGRPPYQFSLEWLLSNTQNPVLWDSSPLLHGAAVGSYYITLDPPFPQDLPTTSARNCRPARFYHTVVGHFTFQCPSKHAVVVIHVHAGQQLWSFEIVSTK